MVALIKILRTFGLIALMGLINLNSGYCTDLTDTYIQSKPGGNSLNKKRWEKLKNNYKYKSPKIDSTSKKQSNQRSSFSIGEQGWLKVLAYIAIFLVFAGVIYLLARFGFFGDKKFKNKPIEFDIHSDLENINDIVIDPLLAKALDDEDYRLATRLRFLELLQTLNHKNLIQWKRERTNQIYIQQLGGGNIQLPFRMLCVIYETVWYGDYLINKERYKTVDDKFNQTFLLLGKPEHV